MADDLFKELSNLDLINFSKTADDLFGELSHSNLLDFLHTQNLSDIKNMQEFNLMQSKLHLQSANTKHSIL